MTQMALSRRVLYFAIPLATYMARQSTAAPRATVWYLELVSPKKCFIASKMCLMAQDPSPRWPEGLARRIRAASPARVLTAAGLSTRLEMVQTGSYIDSRDRQTVRIRIPG